MLTPTVRTVAWRIGQAALAVYIVAMLVFVPLMLVLLVGSYLLQAPTGEAFVLVAALAAVTVVFWGAVYWAEDNVPTDWNGDAKPDELVAGED